MTGRPVRIALSREAVFRLVGGRTPSRQRVAIAADAGRHASRHSSTKASRRNPTTTAFPEQFSFPPRHLYAMAVLPHRSEGRRRSNRVANTFMRAPGESIGTFAVESAIDALSYELQLDPIELRLRNEPDDRSRQRARVLQPPPARSLSRIGAERFGWRNASAGAAHAARRRLADRPRRRDRNLSRLPHGDGGARAHQRRRHCARSRRPCQEMGMGTATVQTQHAAERLGLPMENVRFEYGDSSLPCGRRGRRVVADGQRRARRAAGRATSSSKSCSRWRSSTPTRRWPKASVEGRACARTAASIARTSRRSARPTPTILQRAGQTFVEREVKTGSAPRNDEVFDAFVRGAVLRSARARADRRGPRSPLGRRRSTPAASSIRRPPSRQFRGGIIMGIGMALTEETHLRRAHRPHHEPVARRVSRAGACRRSVHRHRLHRHSGSAHAARRARHRRNRHHRASAAAIANAVYQRDRQAHYASLPITLDKLM